MWQAGVRRHGHEPGGKFLAAAVGQCQDYFGLVRGRIPDHPEWRTVIE